MTINEDLQWSIRPHLSRYRRYCGTKEGRTVRPAQKPVVIATEFEVLFEEHEHEGVDGDDVDHKDLAHDEYSQREGVELAQLL